MRQVKKKKINIPKSFHQSILFKFDIISTYLDYIKYYYTIIAFGKI
jgi:hypothetical protein